MEMRRCLINIAAVSAMLTCFAGVSARSGLAGSIQDYADASGAEIGVAVIGCDGDTTVVNDGYYPMNSVLKMFQALPAVRKLSERGVMLCDTVKVERSALQQNTWSPMLTDYTDRVIALPYARLFEYALAQSDNNACDILFERAASIDETLAYWRQAGIGEFDIKWNEAEMHDAPARSDDNRTTPLAAAKAISVMMPYCMTSSDYNTSNIGMMLLNCSTGKGRIPRPLEGTGAQVAHKTGTGFEDAQGNPTGVNDVAWILLSDGRAYTLAVFVKTTPAGMAQTEAMIADISRIVYDYYAGQNM